MTFEALISQCPEEVAEWNKEMNSAFYKVPILGWFAWLLISGDRKHHLRKWCVPKVFRFGAKVVNDIGRVGTVIEIDKDNCRGAGYGPIPYVVVKYDDGTTKKYDYSELEIVK